MASSAQCVLYMNLDFDDESVIQGRLFHVLVMAEGVGDLWGYSHHLKKFFHSGHFLSRLWLSFRAGGTYSRPHLFFSSTP